MTNPYVLFGTSDELEVGKGVTIDYGSFNFTIHRAGGKNKKYAQLLAQKARPHRNKMANGHMDEELSRQILMECFVEGVLVGWSGVTDRSGKKLEFTHENAMKLFNDLPDLYLDLVAQAEKAENFKEEQEAAEEKN